jgi:DNA-directed RNA polymerase subunit RPC12/RpoP
MHHWTLTFLFATVVMAALFSLFFFHDSGARGRASAYRSQFGRLMQDLEKLVQRANSLERLASSTKASALLEHYHSAIKMIETLLNAVKKLRTHGTDPDTLQAPIFLAGDINTRLSKIESAMSKDLRGKPHNFTAMGASEQNSFIGCHFCSKPFEAVSFAKVKVKFEDKNTDVTACQYCREKLLSTRKARVLFFTEGGQQVHWSKAKTWTPTPEYWEINRDPVSSSPQPSRLKIAYSKDSRPSV